MNIRLIAALAVTVAVLVAGGMFWKDQNSRAGLPPVEAGPIVIVTVPDLTGEALEGQIAFQESCAACHGGNAEGRQGLGPPLVHNIYKPSHHGDGAFLLAANRGVRAHHWTFGDMPPVSGVNGQDIGKIVKYVRALQRANGIY
ncbi:c-type cytochrome [Roseibium sp. SCP14]|uniref:c-type cytochrome n=1 Tax=Roseibium sp. SCP14 TaxID=3141375 RepID=UPI003334DA13